jgi:putative tricarboxylic transport membrane protein
VLDVWLAGFVSLLDVNELLFLAIGMSIGMFVGVLPGLGGTTALALLTPVTFGMEPTEALALAGGVLGGTAMGGAVTAILLNTPGQTANAVTCLDGYPLAQQGKAGLAIGAAASANAIGGIIGTISVLIVLPIATDLVLLFGPPEFFLIAFLGLVLVATTSRGKMLRALIAGGIGLMIASIGYSDVTGSERFTMGVDYLWDGVDLAIALIGLFAIAEMMHLTVKGGSIAQADSNIKITGMAGGLIEAFRHWGTVLRGSLIGTFMGVIPGVGGTVASFMSYSMTVQAAKDPESFGKGNIKGVIAPEAAMNAKDGAALIPTLAFGLPGGAEMAVFMGILILHGMQPGPLMLIENQLEIYSLVWAITASCVVTSFVGLLAARPLARLTLIDTQLLAPIIIAISLVGSYAIDMTIDNVVVSAVFGLIGYVMIRFDYPRITLVVAMVLGSLAERNYHQSMLMSDDSWGIFVSRTASLILLVCIVLSLLSPALRPMFKRFSARRLAARAHSRKVDRVIGSENALEQKSGPP